MDKINTCLALDFYGKLLTDKMREIMEYYYFDDLSLAEIADDVGISRQAVHDTVRRAGNLLEEYEEKLGLIRRFRREKNEIDEAIKLLDKGDKDSALELLKAVRDELITE
ncbi:MAG: YlxM family DNA-binding protein [Clostridiales bacterium]|nr:YlxM family DNA-binding protein [Clostridiales bacterium]